MRSVLWLAVLALVACDQGKSADVKTPGDGDTDEPPVPVLLSGPEEVWGVANRDDDDGDGQADMRQLLADDADHAVATFTPSDNGEEVGLTTLRVSLATDTNIRAYLPDGTVLDQDNPEVDLPWTAEPIEVHAEFGSYLLEGTLTVSELDGEGVVANEVQTRVRSAPLILNHHLQPALDVMAVSVNGNGRFIAGYEEALPNLFRAFRGGAYGSDVWIQDEIEFGTSRTPEHELDVCVDSIRDRGLDDVAEDNFFEQDFAVGTWGRGYATSQDSFGNMEVTPPVEGFPFGRIYYGDAGRGLEVHQDLQDLLAAQKIQAPFELDTSWLCVGHVDEFISFIPDTTAPRGFRMVVTDAAMTWEVLEAMPQDTELTRYAGRFNGHGISTVAEMVEDVALRTLNEQLHEYYIDPMIELMKTEIGVTEDEIIRIPGIYEEAFRCGGTTAALIPGMANLVVVNPPGEPVKVFMADPFMRTDVEDQSTDPVIAKVREVFPEDIEIVFLDDWSTYHMALGEVHCGSNVVREPTADWWVDGIELIEEAN